MGGNAILHPINIPKEAPVTKKEVRERQYVCKYYRQGKTPASVKFTSRHLSAFLESE